MKIISIQRINIMKYMNKDLIILLNELKIIIRIK